MTDPLHQLQQFQAQQLSQQSVNAGRQQGVTFSLPSHTAAPSSVVTTIPSSGASTHHFVLTQFPHHSHPSTSSSSAQPHGFIYTPTSSAAPSNCAPSSVLGSLPITSGLLAPNSAGIQIAGGSSGLPAIPVSSAAIFRTSGIPLGPSGVLVGPSGAMFQPSALPITAATGSSPGSPFSVPTRSPAPHAPPTPSPSPLPLRSPAHPTSPTASPYHSQLQSPQNAGFIPMRSGPPQSTSSSPQSPYQSPMSQPSPHCQPGAQVIAGGKNSAVRSPAPSTGGALTPAPSPSPQHRTAPSVSPVVRPATPQPSQSSVIHQALQSGLALPGGQQFPAVPQGGAAMLQAGNQLVQIIHHQPTSVAAPTFPSHTQIITSGAPMHLQPAPVASITTTPNKPKQPPQILPKPPGSAGLATQGGHHGKMATSGRPSLAVTSQQQALHTQHHTSSGAQVVIGQANQAVIPTAQAGTLLLNQEVFVQVIPGLTSGAPVLVQQNAGGSVQFILRPPTPGAQNSAQSAKSSAPQHGAPMLISGPQLVHNARAQQALQPQQVLRLITTHGAPMQLQQIHTPSGPTLIAVPSGQTLSFHSSSSSSSSSPRLLPRRPPPPPAQSSLPPARQFHAQACGGQPHHHHHHHHHHNAPPQHHQASNGPVQDFPGAGARAQLSQLHQQQQQQQQQQHVMVLPPALAPPKKKPKKKKKKKKDEERKLDLANLMKISGIDDEDGMTLYDCEETGSQQIVDGASPASGGEQNSSDMVSGQHDSPVSLQGGTQTAFKFSVEDGKVVFQPEVQGLTPSQANSASLLLQNLMAQGQSGVSQQSLAEAHNQLSNLLARSTNTSSPGSASQVVLSQLLQQTSNSSTPQLVSTGTNTTSRACGTNSPTSLGSSNFSTVPHSSDRFSAVPPTPKTCSPTLTRDAFTEIQHSLQGSKGSDGTMVTSPVYSIPSKTQGVPMRNSFPNLPLCQPSSVGKYADNSLPGNILNGRDHNTSTCSNSVHNIMKSMATNCSTQVMMGSGDHSSSTTLPRSTSLPCNLPTHLHSSTAPVGQKPSSAVTSSTNTLSSLRATILQADANKAVCLDVGHVNKQSSYAHSAPTADRPIVLMNSNKQTENMQDGNKVCDGFLSPTSLTTKTTCSSTEPTPSFLGLQSFPNLQSLVSSGGTMPFVPTTSSSMTYSGTEQLVIAHPGGLSSVIATPQLLQCLQQAQGHGLVNMPSLQLAPNILNKGSGNAGLAFGTGTIVFGGPAQDNFNSQPAQNKTSPIPNNAKSVPQQSVLVQQLNCSQRRSSSDSNSSLSLGSPPPIVSMVSQGVGTQSHRKMPQSHQSIETQTVAVGTAVTTTTNMSANLPNTFLDSLSQTHPNLVVNTKVGGKPVLNVTNMTTAAVLNKKLKKPKRNERIIPVKFPQMGTSPTNSLCVNIANSGTMTVNQQRVYAPNSSQSGVDTTKVALQERILSKSVATSQHSMAMSCATTLPFVVTSPQYTAASNKTVVTSCVPTLSSSTQSPHPSILCQTSGTNGTPVVSSSPSHLGKLLPGQQIARSIATQVHSSFPGDFPGPHHLVVSSLPSSSAPSQGNTIITTMANTTVKTCVTSSSSGVPHLVPFPQSGGSSSCSSSSSNSNSNSNSSGLLSSNNSIIQKVHTIQLTPQNQKHLKAVQMQIEVLQSRKQLLTSEQESLQRLYDEQKRILATGKVVPTIPGQHAQGLHFNSSLEHSGDQRKSPATTTASSASTYLANLLRQPASHQNAQVTGTVRYQHQVGNQVITFPPSNQQKNSHSSSSGHSVYRATSHGTQTTDSPPALPHGDHPSSRQQLPNATEAGESPRVAVVSPAVQLSKSQSPVVTMCEKGTSPIQVQQVGTQTTPLSELLPRIVPCSSSSGEAAKSSGLPSPQLKTQCAGLPKVVPNNVAKVVPTTQGLPTPAPGPTQTLSPVSPPVRTAQRPATSPARPTISRSDLIEQQLKTDKNGALMPDTRTPFTGTSDACKRLIRYHVFNEQVLSQQDLEKADEIFEATAKHLLDKFRQMMNKYRYLLLMESTREVNTSELIMIDRMFVAEEHSILERLRQNEVKVKDELVSPPEPKPEASADCDSKGLPGEERSLADMKEVRVVVQDVMKNVSIKRELEEDQKFTIVKKEPGGSEQRYDEWLEIQKELGVYCDPNAPQVKAECGRNVAVPLRSEAVHSSGGDASMLGEDSMQRTRNCSPPGRDEGGACRERPRDEGGGSEVSERTKRKEVCDIAESGASPFRHKKRRHKRSSSDEEGGAGCDENDDINAQVQSAIDSILNLQRSEDGFELPAGGAGLAVPAPAEMDAEETRQHLFGSEGNPSPGVAAGGSGFAEDSGASSGNPEDDPVLDEAVRSILTS
ncbi:mucin-2 [Bacillus rossius redtenbacheri]|uniref:mucin-2 n=1 Tax=Bacillus rossius redtenbacheri TaxID=93214 RepID=UPI002FDD677F